MDTSGLVIVVTLHALEGLEATDVGGTATGHDTLGNGCAGCAQRVVHAVLLLLHLDLAGSTDVEDGNATRHLSETLLEFLLVVGRFGILNLHANLSDAVSNHVLVAGAIDDGGVLLVNGNLLGSTQHFEGSLLEGQTGFLADDGATGEDSDVLQHLLATVAKARSLHSAHLERATQAVHYQRCQSLAVNVLGDDEHGTMSLYGTLQQRQQVLQARNLLVKDEDVGALHLACHFVGIGDKIGRNVATVKLHTLDHINAGLGALGLLDGDDTVLFHLLHRLGNELADSVIVVGADACHVLNLAKVVTHFLGLFLDALDNGLDSLVDTALHIHGISAGSHVLEALGDDGLCQNGSGGGAVTGIVVSLAGDLLNELCTNILEFVLQFHLTGNGHTVLGDVGSTIFLVENHVTALGTKGDLNGVAQLVNALLELFTSLDIKFY